MSRRVPPRSPWPALAGRSLFCLFFLTLAPPSPVAWAQSQVGLSLPQYEVLRQRAAAEIKAEPRPPVPLAFDSAEFAVEVRGESARLVQNLSLTQLGSGWQSLTLPAAGGFVAADFGGEEARLEPGEDGWRLSFPAVGPHHVRLESVLPLRRDPGRTRERLDLELPLPNAALVVGAVETGDGLDELTTDSGAVLTRLEGRRWRFVAQPGAVLKLSFWGKALAPEPSELPLSFEAVSATAVTARPTRRTLEAWVAARVLSGELETLRFRVPRGFEVLSVEGANLAGWTLEDGLVTATLAVPVSDRFTVEVQLAAEGAARFTQPVLVVDDAVRTHHVAKAGLGSDGLLEMESPGSGRSIPSGATEPLLAQLPPAFLSRGGELRRLDDATRPPEWRITWSAEVEVLVAEIDRLLAEVLVGEDGTAYYQLWAEVRSRGAAELRLALPEGSRPVVARRDGEGVELGAVAGDWVMPLPTLERTQVVYLAVLVPLGTASDGRLVGSEGRRGDQHGQHGGWPLQVPLPRWSMPVGRVEARLLLPGGRRWVLTESSQVGRITSLPNPPTTERVSLLGQQLLAAPTGRPEPADFTDLPPGYIELQAAWTALSATPSPIRLQSEALASKEDWL